jgi:hypothetical protein
MDTLWGGLLFASTTYIVNMLRRMVWNLFVINHIRNKINWNN